MKHCVSYMKQTVVWGSVACDSSLIHEITQLQYAYCMKHTVVSWPFSLGHAYIQQRRLWFLYTLQFLLYAANPQPKRVAVNAAHAANPQPTVEAMRVVAL